MASEMYPNAPDARVLTTFYCGEWILMLKRQIIGR
ncbi:unnamed protein product [Arabidopsis halleri]